MQRSLKKLKGFEVRATDGEVGHVEDFLFDDERWVIRYLVTNTGGALGGRRILLSPMLVDQVSFDAEMIALKLASDKISDSPDIDTKKPISRKLEEMLYSYYEIPAYWGGFGLWGSYMNPRLLAGSMSPDEEREKLDEENRDSSHLRSIEEVWRYRINYGDEDFARTQDFVIDEETWQVTGIVINTGRVILRGKKYLLKPSHITGLSWSESRMYVDVSESRLEGLKNEAQAERAEKA